MKIKNYLIKSHSISLIFVSYFSVILTSTLQTPFPTHIKKKMKKEHLEWAQNVNSLTKIQVGGYSLILGRFTTRWEATLYSLLSSYPYQEFLLYNLFFKILLLGFYFYGQYHKCNLCGGPMNSILPPCQDLEKLKIKQKDGQNRDKNVNFTIGKCKVGSQLSLRAKWIC